MAGDTGQQANFGCERCWPSSADAAWEARGALTHVADLIDESHVHVMILACPNCAQRFLSIFTETVDWMGGDDAQCWKLMPITAVEAADLIHRQDSLTEAELATLGAGRRCLWRDHPTAATPCTFWQTGITDSLHD